jgi:hypothetical protein
MIILIDVEKILCQNSTSFHDKSSEETSNRRIVPQHNSYYVKPIAYITLNTEKLKSFPLKSGI